MSQLAKEPFFSGELKQFDELSHFPKYIPEFLNDTYARTEKPVLILAGERDLSTPAELALNAAPNYYLPAQQVIIVPWATHGVLVSGPKTADGSNCAVSLREAFLKTPEVRVDTSCLKSIDDLIPNIPPNDAQLPPEFGLKDSVWGD